MLYHILHMAIQLCEEGTMARRIWKGSDAPFIVYNVYFVHIYMGTLSFVYIYHIYGVRFNGWSVFRVYLRDALE